MQAKYCFKPDNDKFFRFLQAQGFTAAELLQLKLLRIGSICVAEDGDSWELHFSCSAKLELSVLKTAEQKLAAAFSLTRADFICDGDGGKCLLPQREPAVQQQEPKAAEDGGAACDYCEAPLPEEPPDFAEMAGDADAAEIGAPASSLPEPLPCDLGEEPEDAAPEAAAIEQSPEYLRAMAQVYGDKKARENGLLWGKAVKGKVRELASLAEEENRVVVEGIFVKSIDRDGKLAAFVERELRTGAVMLTFNLTDESNGIYVKLRFDKHGDRTAREECKAFKELLKPGMHLRILGNVAPDRFMNDEMTLTPLGIMQVPVAERLDQAEVKRVELHCHTKMSKLDALTDMEALVQKAVKWGHKALAITDHGVVQAFPFCFDAAEGSDIKLIFGMEGYLINDRNFGSQDFAADYLNRYMRGRGRAFKEPSYFHIIILAKNEIGLRNLYKLVTISHLRYYNKRPLLPRELLEEYRDGLLFGSACEAGEFYKAVEMGAPDEVLAQIAAFYDYLEIQPTGNNQFLVRENICTLKELEEHNRRIVNFGRSVGKMTVATCDVHFLNPEDHMLRAVLQYNYDDSDFQPPLYFRTTEEMLAEFAYLGKDVAYEVCVENSNKIAEMIERIKPVPDRDQLYSPFIPGVEERIHDMAYQRAREWYGDELPPMVEERLQMELDSIINHGYAVLYYIAHKLVTHSLDRGYLVGSRGSVGSSFVANMIDITEVNALKPHYRCPKCRHSEFFLHNEVDSGFDLPPKDCPHCGTPMIRDGHDIPFAVFMGFHGDKVPDIDLNFSGDDQPVAHKYTEELFGRDNVCRAGTISTVAIKTAIGYVLKYYEKKNLHVHPAKVAELAAGINGVKRTTGQHPGGIMVIPRNMDIHYITPMNRPADDKNSPTVTTHYDYHSINDRLVKLDILGHDDPTVIKMLEDLTGIPAKDIPVGDEATMRIFQDTTSLGVTPEQIFSEVGTFGIPECGTSFVRQMIFDVKPKNFSEVVRVSGYSHGTDVWLNNAQDLIKAGKPVKETISTRDDVMTSLIAKGVEPLLAFKTMEHVRKGKAAKKGLEPQMLEAMKKANVPEWYIESCKKVQYLFPKAHAVAYVLMAYRIAYCKVHYPREYYAAYFSKRAPDFDVALAMKGKEYIKQFIKNVYQQGFKATAQDRSAVTYLELLNEMLERGYILEPLDLYRSEAVDFQVTPKGLRPPLAALSGVGEVAARAIVRARREGGEFISQEDLRLRAGVGKSVVERLAEIGVLGDLPEDNQCSLF